MAAFETMLQQNLDQFSPARTEPGALGYGHVQIFWVWEGAPQLSLGCSIFQGSLAQAIWGVELRKLQIPRWWPDNYTTRVDSPMEQTHDYREARATSIDAKTKSRESSGNRDLLGVVPVGLHT